MEVQKFIKEIVKVVRRHLGPEYKILLYGSWAKGDAIDTSDVDIAISGPEKVSAKIMLDIQDEVGKIPSLRSTDIVDLNAVGERLKKEILCYAKQL